MPETNIYRAPFLIYNFFSSMIELLKKKSSFCSLGALHSSRDTKVLVGCYMVGRKRSQAPQEFDSIPQESLATGSRHFPLKYHTFWSCHFFHDSLPGENCWTMSMSAAWPLSRRKNTASLGPGLAATYNGKFPFRYTVFMIIRIVTKKMYMY